MIGDDKFYEFPWADVVAMMLRERGISTGYWQPGARLRFGAAMAGPSSEDALPSGIVSVHMLTLRQVPGPGEFIFSAEEVLAASSGVVISNLPQPTAVAKKTAPRKRAPKPKG